MNVEQLQAELAKYPKDMHVYVQSDKYRRIGKHIECLATLDLLHSKLSDKHSRCVVIQFKR